MNNNGLSNWASFATALILLLTLVFEYFRTNEERKIRLFSESLERYEKFISNICEDLLEYRKKTKQQDQGTTNRLTEVNSYTEYYYGDRAIETIFIKAEEKNWSYETLRYEKAPVVNSLFHKLHTCINSLELLPKRELLFFQKPIQENYKKMLRDSITYQQQCLLYLESIYVKKNQENLDTQQQNFVNKIKEYNLIYELTNDDKQKLKEKFLNTGSS